MLGDRHAVHLMCSHENVARVEVDERELLADAHSRCQTSLRSIDQPRHPFSRNTLEKSTCAVFTMDAQKNCHTDMEQQSVDSTSELPKLDVGAFREHEASPSVTSVHDGRRTTRRFVDEMDSAGPRLRESLVQSIEGPASPRRQRATIELVGTIGLPVDVTTISSALKHGHRQVRQAASEAMTDLECPPGFVADVPSERLVRARCRSCLNGKLLLRQHRESFVPATGPGGCRRKTLSAVGRHQAASSLSRPSCG